MASEVIAFPVNLRKNKNQYNAGYGQYYPEARPYSRHWEPPRAWVCRQVGCWGGISDISSASRLRDAPLSV